jgi:hypothetical protein
MRASRSCRLPRCGSAAFGGDGVHVGIVDTGADRRPDFGDRIVAYRDFTESGADDEVGHGTHVAGVVAGAGALYRGVAPKASLVIAKALTERGGTDDTVLAALSWLSRLKVDVGNLSLGGPGDPHDPLSREVNAPRAGGSSSASPRATRGLPRARSVHPAAPPARSPLARSTSMGTSRRAALGDQSWACGLTSRMSSPSGVALRQPRRAATEWAWRARARRRSRGIGAWLCFVTSV